ncbi:hypothetical protein BG842_19480 [Haladaptatus sp. W1]|nr:hypothetical protein BG842_19480 [Haladaptatus sp. W1]
MAWTSSRWLQFGRFRLQLVASVTGTFGDSINVIETASKNDSKLHEEEIASETSRKGNCSTNRLRVETR